MINYKKLTAAMAAGIIAIFTITGRGRRQQMIHHQMYLRLLPGIFHKAVRMHCRLNLTAKI